MAGTGKKMRGSWYIEKEEEREREGEEGKRQKDKVRGGMAE